MRGSLVIRSNTVRSTSTFCTTWLQHVVEGRPYSAALDLDTILFLDKDTPFGRVFDVFGPVEKPFYAIRLDPRHADTADQTVDKYDHFLSSCRAREDFAVRVGGAFRVV
jgi:rRNA processing protein Gar1